MPSPDNILITGGFGFLGGHLAKALLESGFNVTLFDNCAWHSSPASSMQISSLSGLARLQGSVLNHDDLLLAGNGFDYIIHAAGFLGIRRVAENPISTLDVNVIGTRHVLELACAQRQLKKFLFFSSSEIYGHQAHSSFEDDDAIVSTTSPRWSYAASKLAGEFYVKGFGQEHALPFVIVRPFNVYGPFRTGANAMTEIVRRAVDNQSISISGTGAQTRSWCHVDDFVRGAVSCLLQEKASGHTFNIGNDRTYISMLELARLVCELLGSSSEIKTDGSTEEDVQVRLASIGKARQMLDYEPRIDLPSGIMDVASWIRRI